MYQRNAQISSFTQSCSSLSHLAAEYALSGGGLIFEGCDHLVEPLLVGCFVFNYRVVNPLEHRVSGQ